MKYEKKERKLFVLNMSVQTSIYTLYATPILSFLPSTMPTIFSAEVVRIELIVPLRLIKCLIHGECIMVDSLVLPLAILVKPFGELPSGEEIPSTNFKNKTIVRCRECRAYANPFIKFFDNGSRWVCNFC